MAIANTFTQIGSTVTVGNAGSASITFTSIPATYTDLVILASTRSNRSEVNDGFFVYLNGNTANITAKRLYGNSSSGSQDGGSSILNDADTATASIFSNSRIYIPNYALAENHSWSGETVTENNSATNAFVSLVSAIWASATIVTSITLTNETGTGFMQYSTASLYGILKY